MPRRLPESGIPKLRKDVDALRQRVLELTRALGMKPGATPQLGGAMPGAMWIWPGAIAPEDWLLCDGASYTTADYPELALQLAGRWGNSDPLGETFLVPDLRDRLPVGAADGVAGGSTALGVAMGPADLPSRGPDQRHPHTHTLGTSSSGGDHDHGGTVTGTDLNLFSNTATQAGGAQRLTGPGNHFHNIGTHTGHTHPLGNSGGSNDTAGHPRVGLNFIIRT